MRPDHRSNEEMRPVHIERGVAKYAEGSALISLGDTRVLCTATVDEHVPPFLKDSGTGWVTAEYAMLPRSAGERIQRDSVKKGRALEISRLIGRSLRAVVDLELLGERQIIIDCDVLQADGSTRTAAITGSYVALKDAMSRLVRSGVIGREPLLGQCAAVSVGVVQGEIRLDLCYEEDVVADVDMNLVMRSDGMFIEVQCTAEGDAFSREMLQRMLDLGEKGIAKLFDIQRSVLTHE
ncbi:MAG TPA: ribonuclease PH [Candidatus Hydrogenedentes bacterium]|nr:ribonuclease PH [Candidatus Hydrogenedentota bacterium]HOL77558.1 ribonuclease PH [Candidatus Hydrogenedentota bacterium]HPO84863.1 ribonuclease PH [Candidatus Hydrogenedentota bacterium]